MNYITEEECIDYADLILFLVDARVDDTVMINAEFEHESLVSALTKQAYKKGVKHVEYNISSEKFAVYRAMHSPEEYLSYLPESSIARMRECCEKKTCIVSIRSPQDPEIAAAASPDALRIIHQTRREKMDFFHKAIISDALTWIVTAFPTEGWAKNVYPNLEPAEGVRALWGTVRYILRLDEQDVIAAWKDYQQVLNKRGTFLNNKKYKALRLVGDDTDLTVALNERSVWSTGTHVAENGKTFQANVPTEEVYTSPDCRYTSGTVRIRRPITILGKKIEGITMRFENGRVVEFDASVNKEVLDSFFQTHERNRYIGELALVDTHSRVWKSGQVFNSILYDENAGVHFALGAAYTTCFGFAAGEEVPSDDKLIKMGCNASSFHEDFTAGYEGLSVFGVPHDESAAPEPIITDGVFVL